MRRIEENIGETRTSGELIVGQVNDANGYADGMKSTPTNGHGMRNEKSLRPPSKTRGASGGALIRVSEEQFLTMKEETLASLNLLNCSGNVLLSAMESITPPPESGRAMGEYSGVIMRKLAKSVCDIVRTKCDVVRQIHSIARDEI